MNTIERLLSSMNLQSKLSKKDKRESKNPKTELHMLWNMVSRDQLTARSGGDMCSVCGAALWHVSRLRGQWEQQQSTQSYAHEEPACTGRPEASEQQSSALMLC